MKKKTFRLLTFYKFVKIEDPHAEVAAQAEFCRGIGMRGRIYLGEEGISATVSCNEGQYQAYRLYLANHPLFQDIPDIEEKLSWVEEHAFEKMTVKYRREIVTIGEQVDPGFVQENYKKIPVEEFKKMLDEGEDFAVLDMRNSYEFKLGHFKNAVPAGTVNFREVWDFLGKYKKVFGEKKVVMYCTGGIRCEKLSAVLAREGLENFWALDGGVVKYVNRFQDGNWLGNLYTFDGLVSTRVCDAATHTKIGRCIFSGQSTDFIENCRYSPCNARILAKKSTYKNHLGFCSAECFEKAQQDLLVKNDAAIEPHDFKELRKKIATGELDGDEIREKIRAEWVEKLGGRQFPHETSQKEEFVDENFFEEFVEEIEK